MTAEIVQFVPRPNPNRELSALEIASLAIIGQVTEPVMIQQERICIMSLGLGQTFEYTAPSEDSA